MEGELSASSVKAASSDLITKGYVPVAIERKSFEFEFLKFFSIPSFSFFNKRKKIPLRDLIIFFRQLSVLFSAGVPLYASLVALEKQIINKEFKKIIESAKKDVEAGSYISSAFARYPATFPSLVIAMLEAGEHGGTMDDILKKIASYLEKESQFRQKMQSALRYPIMVLTVLSVAFIIVINFVVPQFNTLYSSFKTELPLPTRLLIGTNYLFIHYWWLILGGALLSFTIFKMYVGSYAGRKVYDRFLLRVPIFGELIAKLSLARFFRLLSSLLSSGVIIERSLELSAGAVDNVILSRAIIKIKEKVLLGDGLSVPMAMSGVFPPVSVQMVSIGEKSGNLATMLVKNADYIEEEADYMVSNLMTLLEPFLVFFLAVLILILALGIYLPIWSMMSLYAH